MAKGKRHDITLESGKILTKTSKNINQRIGRLSVSVLNIDCVYDDEATNVLIKKNIYSIDTRRLKIKI